VFKGTPFGFSVFSVAVKIYVMASKQICVVVCQVVLDGSLNHIIYGDKKTKKMPKREIFIVNYITLCLIFYFVHNMLLLFFSLKFFDSFFFTISRYIENICIHIKCHEWSGSHKQPHIPTDKCVNIDKILCAKRQRH
jgi:hypothetical protein